MIEQLGTSENKVTLKALITEQWHYAHFLCNTLYLHGIAYFHL